MSAPRVVLVGPPGAGKSTIGRRLARALNIELTDTDALIEEREGRSCAQILVQDGEPEFRRIEEECVAAALQHNGIVSLGGGAVLSARTRRLLADHLVVYIEVSAEEGIRRTQEVGDRPLLSNSDDHAARYREILAARRPLYQETSTYRVRSDGRSPQRVVADILSFLENHD